MSLPSAQDSAPAPSHGAAPHAPITDPAHLLPAHASETPGKGSWLRKLILLAIILGAIAFVFLRIRSNKAEADATADRSAAASNRPTPVLTSAVQMKTVPVYLTALGTVTAYNTVTLHSRVDGQLLSVNFREGQNVSQGQLLLKIDPRPYQAALAQAQGQLAKDQATQRNAEAEAQRYTALFQAGVVSRESQQTQIANSGVATGSIQADNAAIQAAKVNLGYTSIYSPINGVVGLRGVDPGNIVHSGDAAGLVVITQIHPISVIFTLPEDQLPQVQNAMKGGSKLVVEAYDRGDAHKVAAGTLLTIDNQIDTTTGTAKLKAVFENADNALFANQFVNVRLILMQRQNAIVVPSAAIQSGTQGSFVFVVHPGPTPANKRPQGAGAGGGSHKRNSGGDAAGGGKAAASGAAEGGSGSGGKGSRGGAGGGQQGPPMHVDTVPVHVDFTQGANSVLASGTLKEGDIVVIDGQEKLIDGGNVSPQAAAPQHTPTANPGAAGGAIGAGGTAAAGTSNDVNAQGNGPRRGRPAEGGTGSASNGGARP